MFYLSTIYTLKTTTITVFLMMSITITMAAGTWIELGSVEERGYASKSEMVGHPDLGIMDIICLCISLCR